MAIRFHVEDIEFSWKNKRLLSNWIKEAVVMEGRTVGEINVILCSDNYLIDMNKRFLNHDYYTDIITFDYSVENTISGDLYISYDRVEDNASALGVSSQNEIYRVVIHGVMHLAGYSDKSKRQKQTMRERENFYLSILPKELTE